MQYIINFVVNFEGGFLKSSCLHWIPVFSAVEQICILLLS